MDQPTPNPVNPGSTKTLNLGIKDGRVVIGIGDKPIAVLMPEQAAVFGSMLIAKSISIAFGTHMVTEALDKSKQEANQTPPNAPN